MLWKQRGQGWLYDNDRTELGLPLRQRECQAAKLQEQRPRGRIYFKVFEDKVVMVTVE